MASAAILRAARARIANRANWAQGAWARDAKGKSVAPTGDRAVCWCAMGAIDAERGTTAEFKALRRAVSVVVGADVSIAWINDGSDHGTILAIYDAAIAEAEARF